MWYKFGSTKEIYIKKLSIVCLFVFPEWVHAPPHSCSLWKYQCSYIAVESGCCCGLHCKGKNEIIVILKFVSSLLWNTFSTMCIVLASWEAWPDSSLYPKEYGAGCLCFWTEPELYSSLLNTSILIKTSCWFHSIAKIQWDEFFHL